MTKEFEIKSFEDLLDVFENTDGYYLGDFTCFQIADYLKNMKQQLEFKDLILKALHKYFTEHEEYENDEFLKQLESCTKNDMIWLKRMAGDEDANRNI